MSDKEPVPISGFFEHVERIREAWHASGAYHRAYEKLTALCQQFLAGAIPPIPRTESGAPPDDAPAAQPRAVRLVSHSTLAGTTAPHGDEPPSWRLRQMAVVLHQFRNELDAIDPAVSETTRRSIGSAKGHLGHTLASVNTAAGQSLFEEDLAKS